MDATFKEETPNKDNNMAVVATTDTFLIAWLITGKVDWAAGIGI